MAKNWETEILTSLGMTVGEVGGGGGGIYHPHSALSEIEKLYMKNITRAIKSKRDGWGM